MNKKLSTIVGIVFAAAVVAYGWWSYVNKAVVPEQIERVSTPSLGGGINQSDQEAMFTALKNLDTSENYTYFGPGGIGTTPKGFTSQPVARKNTSGWTASMFIKLVVNGTRGPVVLRQPANINIQAWVDPAAGLSDCKLNVRATTRPVKAGEFVLENINNLTYSEQNNPYIVSLGCTTKDDKGVVSAVEVWIFE